MSNFDTVDQIIQQSIDILQEAVTILAKSDARFTGRRQTLNDLKSKYHAAIVIVMANNHSNEMINFYNEIERLDLPNTLNEIADFINTSGASVKVLPLLSKYNKLPKYETIEKPIEDIMRCKSCNEIMTLSQAKNEFECVCGIIKNSEGYACEEISYVDGQPSISHKTNYIKAGHSYKWLIQSQARENFEFPRNVIKEIHRQFQVDSIYDRRQVNCNVMRKTIKTLQLTEYNSHIPLLIKETTATKKLPGKMPFQLSGAEFDLIIDKIILILEIIGEIAKGNSPFHPFLLMKIIEQELPESTRQEKYRKSNIIVYFHIQNENTLKEKDQFWKTICDYMPGYNYIATDIDKYKLWSGMLI